MDFFKPIVPEEKFHPNFARSLLRDRIGEREEFTRWGEGFPDRDNKLVREFQTTFNSSFWEVYLHGLFKAYAFEMNWSSASPDFWLKTRYGDVIVEAVTANAARGATPEWLKSSPMTENVRRKEFWPLNREAIIRLSNALLDKWKKYNSHYKKIAHVAGKPFVVAVAPFEQPDFQYQYDRPMRALLYDEYVDEDTYIRHPERFPDGPPSVSLGSVEKDNGRSIDLGIFNNDAWSEVSAVMYSCVATWGKTVAMSTRPRRGEITAAWSISPSGVARARISPIGVPSEKISDGIQFFDNPNAKYPLDPQIFRHAGVVQHYQTASGWEREEYDSCLQSRTAVTFGLIRGDEMT